MSKLQHRLHVLIYESLDLPGTWVAHCLDLGIISQGNSAPHAVEMISEAIELAAKWAMEEGRPPFELRPAPVEDWDRLRGSEPLVTRILRIPTVAPEVVIEPVISRAS